jgi:hypothetical protein
VLSTKWGSARSLLAETKHLELGRKTSHIDLSPLCSQEPELLRLGEASGRLGAHPHDATLRCERTGHVPQCGLEERAHFEALEQPASHGRVGDDQRNCALGAKRARVADCELVTIDPGRPQIVLRRLERPRIEIRSVETGVQTEVRALHELGPRAHEWVPHDVVGSAAGGPRQRRGDGGMGRCGDRLLSISKPRIGEPARSQLHEQLVPPLAFLLGKRCFPGGSFGIVDQIGPGFLDRLRHPERQPTSVAGVSPLDSVANGPSGLGERLENFGGALAGQRFHRRSLEIIVLDLHRRERKTEIQKEPRVKEALEGLMEVEEYPSTSRRGGEIPRQTPGHEILREGVFEPRADMEQYRNRPRCRSRRDDQ